VLTGFVTGSANYTLEFFGFSDPGKVFYQGKPHHYQFGNGKVKLTLSGGGTLQFGGNSSIYQVALATTPVLQNEAIWLRPFPNPFNPKTWISFNLPVQQNVSLHVYSLTGKKVAVLLDNQSLQGRQRIAWDAGKQPSGLYFYLLQVGQQVLLSRGMLLK